MQRLHRSIRRIVSAFVLLTGFALLAAPACAESRQTITRSGTLHGAPYRIDIPPHWNHRLVMVMHGYEPVGAKRTTPMTPDDSTAVFLKLDYAVAQSAYASQGWAVADALPDTERLRRYFTREFGAPRSTYVVGFSLGGLETVAMIERHRHAYAGALALCGATVSTPKLLTRVGVTPLVAFDALIPGVLPNLTAPDAPRVVPETVFAKALQAHPQQAAILEKRLQETPKSLPTALMVYYLVLHEFVHRAGGLPAGNRHTVYHGFGDDTAFNRKVRRYAAMPKAVAYARRHVTLSGRIDTPLVMQWNAFDPIIPARLHAAYPHRVRAAGRGKLLTVLAPVGQGHCGFTLDQIGAAFGTLVRKTRSAR